MPKSRLLEIRYPAAGVVRRLAFQNQPPYTTPYAVNARPFDTLQVRDRGGNRPGLLLYSAQELDQDTPPQMLFSALMLNATGDNSGSINYSLLAISGGQLYYTDYTGVIGTATGLGASLNADAPTMHATQIGGLVYIADWRSERPQGSGSVDTSEKIIDIGMAIDIDTSLDRICIKSATYDGTPRDALAGTYQITAVDDEELTINWPDSPYATGTIKVEDGVVTLTGGAFPSWAAGGILSTGAINYFVSTRDSDTQVTLLNCDTLNVTAGTSYSLSIPDVSVVWEIVRPVKVFDPSTQAVSHLTETYGIIPPNCPLVCVYRNRLVLAGPNHVFYCSRAGDPTDWDYGADPDDTARAVGGTTFEGGEIGGPIRALIPHSDDYLIIACDSSLHVLRGDPASGGQIDVLSREVGVVSSTSWCMLPDSSVLILAHGGLYQVPAGASNFPVEFSRDKLPFDLTAVDPDENVISMVYDPKFHGVHLYITPVDGSTGSHWWIDWANKGFWPVALRDNHQPTAACAYLASASTGIWVVLAGVDGWLRSYEKNVHDDQDPPVESPVTYPVSSEVAIGPFRLAPYGQEGIITDLQAVLDSEGDPVDWEMYVGSTAQNVYDATVPDATGTWLPGVNVPSGIRLRGEVALLRVKSTSVWGLESICATLRPGGIAR